ncbi:TIGR01777 family oxidoreductase [Bacillus sp. SG-1]|uniref:TIGR01777 family oxidoreductase n=1 Tax=Bacillus sp. SG-1 TaxID=161544 RepID=UPI0001543AB0|nr:TIGR01777 family oxidoreductase [Bacillus sp. SG-1]EDL65125.1 possible epimerase, NAD dependent epimerase family protein [Bacillus sp. SG-1]
MKAVISGGTGFVGSALTEELLDNGYKVSILTRNPDKHESRQNVSYIKWLTEGAHPEKELEGSNIFINLAGESINSGRWTEERKNRILKSRVDATREMIRILENLDEKPSVFINASAIGIYEASETKTHTGTDFLAETVKRWEFEASKAREFDIRTACTRFGIILGKGEGALPKMALPYKLFAGGTVGSGKQWMSWVHIGDVAKAIRFVIETSRIEGPVNVTAPSPVTMKELGKTLGDVLNRPHWIAAPAFAIKAAMGEMSKLVLEGQKVIPSILMENGYSFEYPDLKEALIEIYRH